MTFDEWFDKHLGAKPGVMAFREVLKIAWDSSDDNRKAIDSNLCMRLSGKLQGEGRRKESSGAYRSAILILEQNNDS